MPEIKVYRYEVICWDESCNGSLDTYGKTEEIVRMAQKHADRNGHSLTVQVKGTIEIAPALSEDVRPTGGAS